MPSRHRKKPLAQLEHGTRIYAPPREARYQVDAPDPVWVSGSSSSAARRRGPR
jgi:hypothetical protein